MRPVVQVHPGPPDIREFNDQPFVDWHYNATKRGISSAGRAPALQAGGQRFDPAILHQDLYVFGAKYFLIFSCNNLQPIL